MDKKAFFENKNYFIKGFAVGILFCGSIAFTLFLVLWIFL